MRTLFEILIEPIFRLVVRMVYRFGVLILKFLTLSASPVSALEDQYKDSVKPWLLGVGAIALIIWLIRN